VKQYNHRSIVHLRILISLQYVMLKYDDVDLTSFQNAVYCWRKTFN